MKYELVRCRFRHGEHRNDQGPEGGSFRYEVSLGFFNNVEECEAVIQRCEGTTLEEITDIKGVLYQGFMKSTGHPVTDPMYMSGYRFDGELVVIKYDEYWDEYEIHSVRDA